MSLLLKELRLSIGKAAWSLCLSCSEMVWSLVPVKEPWHLKNAILRSHIFFFFLHNVQNEIKVQ